MEKKYKGHIIRVTIEKEKGAYPWKPICRILDGAGREFIKQLDWPIGYNTPEQAEKVGLIISKKWIDAGKPAPLSLMILDITELKRAEERFRLAVEASPNAIVMFDEQAKILLVNALTQELFGYSREELIGESVEILVPERFRADLPAHRAAFFAAPQPRAMGVGRDLFARRKDGSEFLVEIGLNPIQTPEGTVVLTAIVDITERKRMEHELQRNREELAHVTRVSTVGELTTSVAHELNQPLGAILSNAEAAEMFLMADPPALDEVRDILADIRKDDQRASEVIRRMRNLLRKHDLAPKSIEINVGAGGSFKGLEHRRLRTQSGHEVREDGGPPPRLVRPGAFPASRVELGFERAWTRWRGCQKEHGKS